MSDTRIQVFLVDDHAMVREGLHVLLDAQPDLQVVGEAESGEQAVNLVRQHRPHVVLMDVTMPGMSGIEATRAIIALGQETRVLGLSVHENPEYFFRMLGAGASGYILKGATTAELAGAIRSVHQGGVYLTPLMAGHMVSEYIQYRDKALKAGDDGLTAREVEVLRLIATGSSNQEVAEKLHVSVYTVQTHRAHIMRKLGLENRYELMRYAMRKGYTDAES